MKSTSHYLVGKVIMAIGLSQHQKIHIPVLKNQIQMNILIKIQKKTAAVQMKIHLADQAMETNARRISITKIENYPKTIRFGKLELVQGNWQVINICMPMLES